MSIQDETTDDLVQKVENMVIDSLTVIPGEETISETNIEQKIGEEIVQQLQPLDVEIHPIKDHETPFDESIISDQHACPLESKFHTSSIPQQIYADPSDDDDGEGEWITPQNAGIHKSRALDLLPDNEAKGKGRKEDVKEIGAGCMTADFAMQNVLLQMQLNLVSVDGKRIQKVRNYVLRCHACFK